MYEPIRADEVVGQRRFAMINVRKDAYVPYSVLHNAALSHTHAQPPNCRSTIFKMRLTLHHMLNSRTQKTKALARNVRPPGPSYEEKHRTFDNSIGKRLRIKYTSRRYQSSFSHSRAHRLSLQFRQLPYGHLHVAQNTEHRPLLQRFYVQYI